MNNNKKNKISNTLRQNVYVKYIESANEGLCYCCCKEKITLLIGGFECGHVVAEANGGRNDIENLRPICRKCNLAMSCKNMIDYILENNYPSKILNEQIFYHFNIFNKECLNDTIQGYVNELNNDKIMEYLIDFPYQKILLERAAIEKNLDDIHKNEEKMKHSRSNISGHENNILNIIKKDEVLYNLLLLIYRNEHLIIICHSKPQYAEIIGKFFKKIPTIMRDDTDIFIKNRNAIYYSYTIPSINYVKYFDDLKMKTLFCVDKLKIGEEIIKQFYYYLNSNKNKIDYDSIFENNIVNYNIFTNIKKNVIRESNKFEKFANNNLRRIEDNNCRITIDDIYRHFNSWCRVERVFRSKNRMVEFLKYNGYECDAYELYNYEIDHHLDEFIPECIKIDSESSVKYHDLYMSYLNWTSEKNYISLEYDYLIDSIEYSFFKYIKLQETKIKGLTVKKIPFPHL